MCNKELLVGFIYDDLSAEDRAALAGHLTICAACRLELDALGRTRQHLAAWAPPEPTMNFRVVQSPRSSVVPLPAPRRRLLAAVPGWGLAAAASLLLLAGAAAIANLEVRYDAAGVVVRTGWSSTVGSAAAPAIATVAAASAPVPAARAASSSEQLEATVAALTRRLGEIEAAQSEYAVRLAAARAAITTPELRKILAESEARQRTEIALRVANLWKDVNASRASDLMRVQQALAPELQRQQRSIENLYRVSVQR